MDKSVYIRWFEDISSRDVAIVGGKNASLGEMIGSLASKGIAVPDGFATTVQAYWEFLEANELTDEIRGILQSAIHGSGSLEEAGNSSIRQLFYAASFPSHISNAIRTSYRQLCSRTGTKNVPVAIRSSATAEDLPQASFAGQQETFLNIRGEDEVIDACRRCFASLFTNRAITYREVMGFDHLKIGLSVGVQKMVRADKGSAGVMFSIDTDTGFPNVVVIDAAWGLGESVVGGAVNPDHYIIFKPLLGNGGLMPILEKTIGSKKSKVVYSRRGSKPTRIVRTSRDEQRRFVLEDAEILMLARWARIVEEHYGKPMDMEWAKDGETRELFLVQARPETVESRRESSGLKTYHLKENGKRLLTGLSTGNAIVAGKVCVIKTPQDISRFQKGTILVARITDPDWVPIMQQAAGIITDQGGRTSHAAIVSRELGVPAVIGTGQATAVFSTSQEVTLSCAEGSEGYVYQGILDFEEVGIDLGNVPETHVRS